MDLFGFIWTSTLRSRLIPLEHLLNCIFMGLAGEADIIPGKKPICFLLHFFEGNLVWLLRQRSAECGERFL